MGRRTLLLAAVTTAGLALAVGASGHHSFSAEFDATKVVTISGTLTQVAWVNPHVGIVIESLDKKGKVVTWEFDSLPPASLRRGGINKSDFKLGEKVTVTGYGSKSGKPVGYLRKVTFANNRIVEIGADPSVPDAPNGKVAGQ